MASHMFYLEKVAHGKHVAVLRGWTHLWFHVRIIPLDGLTVHIARGFSWSWPLPSLWCRGKECVELFSTPPYVFLAWCL